MLIALLNVALSPFCILTFFVIGSNNEKRYFVRTGTNVSKLKVLPYLIFTAGYLLIVFSFTYLITLLQSVEYSVWEVFEPRYYWLSTIGWVATILTLSTYFRGMEGNIMGFIYFPMLVLPALALLVVNVGSLFSFSTSISLPSLDLDLWIRLLGHTFLPIYILLLVNSDTAKEKPLTGIIVIILSSTILQLIMFAISWLLTFVFSDAISFNVFFGEGASLIYYLPMLGGFLYYMLYLITHLKIINDKFLGGWLHMGVMMITLFACLLQIFNYFRLMVYVLIH